MKFIKCLPFLMLFCFANPAESQTKPVFKINHISLFVTDLQRAGNFYINVVGLDTIPEPFHDGKHIWFDIGGGAHLHLIKGASSEKEYYQNNHLCLSTTNIPEFIQKLDKYKIAWFDSGGNPYKVTKRVDGVLQVYLRDPDGYWLEINNDR
jgi:lactoylglutathione lyase